MPAGLAVQTWQLVHAEEVVVQGMEPEETDEAVMAEETVLAAGKEERAAILARKHDVLLTPKYGGVGCVSKFLLPISSEDVKLEILVGSFHQLYLDLRISMWNGPAMVCTRRVCGYGHAQPDLHKKYSSLITNQYIYVINFAFRIP